MNDLESEVVVYTGEVIWFRTDWGFGYILWEKDGKVQTDMFVHFSDIEMDGYKFLKGGQRVSFSIGKNNAGRPKATCVKVI